MFFLQLEGARVRRHDEAVDYKQRIDEERASLKRSTQNNQRWGEETIFKCLFTYGPADSACTLSLNACGSGDG
jgi:hypothetical protein